MMRAWLVWDANPDRLEEEQDCFLVVARDEREAIGLWVGVAECPDGAQPTARPATWGWVHRAEPQLPVEACVWATKHFRGYGMYELDDPTCDWCGERVDPDEYNSDRSVCAVCLEDPDVEMETRICDCGDAGHYTGCTDEKPYREVVEDRDA